MVMIPTKMGKGGKYLQCHAAKGVGILSGDRNSPVGERKIHIQIILK